MNKPWYRRSTFWTSTFFTLGAATAAVVGVLPAGIAAVVGAISTASYAIARGLKGVGGGR